jgi:hypothetical protein
MGEKTIMNNRVDILYADRVILFDRGFPCDPLYGQSSESIDLKNDYFRLFISLHFSTPKLDYLIFIFGIIPLIGKYKLKKHPKLL